jgi:hypothetical protein
VTRGELLASIRRDRARLRRESRAWARLGRPRLRVWEGVALGVPPGYHLGPHKLTSDFSREAYGVRR